MATASISGLGLSGLSSGLDTTTIINKLMAIEASPQTTLKSRLSTASSFRSALQSVNAAVAAVATSAKDAAKPGALTSFTTASTSSAVTATARSTAVAGSVSFTVDRLAATQISVSDAVPDPSTAFGSSITVRTGSGATAKDTTITPASGSLDDLVAAVNTSGSGVTATKIAAGVVGGTQQYRIQFASSTSGSAGAFTLVSGSSYAAGTPISTTTVATAQDAQLTLYGGTAAEQVVTSASNTFSSLVSGVDLTVSATTSTAATITVTPDATAATASAQALVAGLSTLFSGIASATAVTTTTSSTGSKTSTSAGVLTGDGSVRLLKDSLLTAATDAVGGRSPAEIGIVVTKDGTVTFDQAKFAAAMKADSAGTTVMFQTIAGRVASTAAAASDPFTGTLSQKITSQQTTESGLTKEIGDWDTRLATIQAQYTKQFNDLETAMNALSSQASYLTSQIAGLTTNYQNK